MDWKQWIPPYDPRMVNGTIVIQEQDHTLTEIPDCGLGCPGCGICCAGYRGGRAEDCPILSCGDTCPGFEKCCPPFDLRDRPMNTDDARRVLTERDDGQRWEIQESLVILAHEGTSEAAEILDACMPHLPECLKGFAECAADECHYFATVPRNEAEAVLMMKKHVANTLEERAAHAQAKIDEEILPELEQRRYELEIAERLLVKADDETTRERWRIQTDAIKALIINAEHALEEKENELDICDAMISEIQADIDNSAEN